MSGLEGAFGALSAVLVFVTTERSSYDPTLLNSAPRPYVRLGTAPCRADFPFASAGCALSHEVTCTLLRSAPAAVGHVTLHCCCAV